MISGKAVEAAAQAACAGLWERLTPAAQEATIINMRAALSAALPLLLEGKREEIARIIDQKAWGAFDRVVEYQSRPQGEAPWNKYWADLAAFAKRETNKSLINTDRIIAMLGGGDVG